MDTMINLIMLTAVHPKVLSLADHNVSQSSINRPQNGPSMAIDDDLRTCAVTGRGLKEVWKIQFNHMITVKVVQLRLKGGNYTVEVRNSSNELADRHLCGTVHLPFEFSVFSINISCKPAVPVDTIIIKRTDFGNLALCDFKLKVCKTNSLDIPCEKCTMEDTCRHCDEFHYGPDCQHNCSSGCKTRSCDEVTGECLACLDGYSGQQCQHTGFGKVFGCVDGLCIKIFTDPGKMNLNMLKETDIVNRKGFHSLNVQGQTRYKI